MDPLTLTVPKAAAYLGIGRDLMYELVRTGEIPSIRLKNRILVPREACEVWLRKQIDQNAGAR